MVFRKIGFAVSTATADANEVVQLLMLLSRRKCTI